VPLTDADLRRMARELASMPPGLGRIKAFAAFLEDARREGYEAAKRDAAAKIDEQRRLLTAMFPDDRRTEPLCRDLAAAVLALSPKE
jgi:hypothetical protein